MRPTKFRAGRSAALPEPDINVTPLVDVVLVLLIIFMVVTPAMEEGEHIELPQVMKADVKRNTSPIEVTMGMSGKVLVEKKFIPAADFEKVLTECHRKDPEAKVMLNADGRLGYGVVRSAFKKLQDIGFSGVSLKIVEKQGVKVAQAQ
jgi:biopolymer transport protein TolR